MDWFQLADADAVAIPSPALLIYRDRVEANLAEMLRIAGGPARLRPHLKTHKLPQLVRRQVELGIRRFKTATLAEAAMAAQAGARDILLAYQLVGPAVAGLFDLVARFPSVRFACLADDEDALDALSVGAVRAGRSVEVALDLDVGQHRTGIAAGPAAERLYAKIAASPGLFPGGLHAYDGHLGDTDRAIRATKCDEAFRPVAALRERLEAAGLPVPRVVAGGSPTFPIHASRTGVELSPGTTVFWDAGYARKLPDLDFLPAAVLLGRVVSKPIAGHLCLDLGHKAVGSEMPHPRVEFLNLPDARAVTHSEEHLVVETPAAAGKRVGDRVYALPWHVCPTVALHDTAHVIDQGRVTERWTVSARTRLTAPFLTPDPS